MKTARMASDHLYRDSSLMANPLNRTQFLPVPKDSDSAIDEFAQQALQQRANTSKEGIVSSPSDDGAGVATVAVESSLGSYVASVLRNATSELDGKLENMDEYDGLMELIQEHCRVDERAARETLQNISRVVWSGVVPSASPFTGVGGGLFHHHVQQEGLRNGSMSDLASALPIVSEDFMGSSSSARIVTNSTDEPQSCHNSSMVTSPIHNAGQLLPGDLLGEFEEPPKNEAAHFSAASTLNSTPSTNVAHGTPVVEEFPPLGAGTGGTTSNRKGRRSRSASVSSSSGNPNNGTGTQRQADELAASLFRPSSRSHSIDETASSQQSSSSLASGVAVGASASPSLPPTTGLPQHQSYSSLPAAQELEQQNAMYNSHQEWATAVEILLSMNLGVAEEACAAAASLAQADVNIAQYILDQASTAPQVCRHLLKDGCYRADCSFSHDIDGHTCSFWLKGRCSKGNCRFKHGFSEKILDNLQEHQQQHQHALSYDGMLLENTYDTGGYGSAVGYPQEYQEQQQMQGHPRASSSSSWSGQTSSFANVASQGYQSSTFAHAPAPASLGSSYTMTSLSTVRIPQDLWNPHENRDPGVFFLPDPMERYRKVAATQRREDVLDLHFQSTKTFHVVLETLLDSALERHGEVWIVTGTGHHVGNRTHQQGGGALDKVVQEWLQNSGYKFARGKDRNGEGGALLVKQHTE